MYPEAPILDITRLSEVELQPGGWHALESDGGREFRWVDNHARFVLPKAVNPVAKVDLELEAGPGMGRQFFALTLRGEGGDSILAVQDRVQFRLSLSLSPERRSHYSLHADGGGFPCPNDERQLNFRVFVLATPMDLVDLQSGVDLLGGWAPLETSEGQRRRTAGNGARMRVYSPRECPVLCIELAPGVLQSPAGLRMDVLDEEGWPMATTGVTGRTLVGLRLPLKEGAVRELSLYFEWIGRPGWPVAGVDVYSIRLN